jgi:RNA polymerase sigma-70 factor, ECF subfamily
MRHVADFAETALPASQESRVRLQQVRAAFLSLPEEQRAVLHLVAIEGLSYQETAAALDIPVGTVMSRLGRARAALRAFGAGGLSQPQPNNPRPHLRVVGGPHV